MTRFACKVRYISDQLYRACVQPDGGERLRCTGSLAPRGTLKHKLSRDAFAWCEGVHERRYFTRAAVRTALIRLLDFYEAGIPVCDAPGL